MLEHFKHIVEELRGLIADTRSASVSMDHSGSQYLLAVSGGMDSMCMADLWLRCFGAGSFAIAHCNFHLRGEESDGDEALVVKWAEDSGVHLHRVDFDTAAFASEHGLSIEMAARDLRYGWFADLCREYGYDAVVVAHHADDNAETLLLNLLRGTGLSGLHGMAALSTCHPERSEGSLTILRPLLSFTRKQVEGHVLAHKVPYRHDSSNFSSDYKRNKIRNEVFPIFEKINPSYIRTLNREIGYFAEAGSIVEDWCRQQLPDVMGPHITSRHCEKSSDVAISIPRLLAIPQWRYLLYYILEPYGFNSQVLASIETLLTSDRTMSGKRFESPTHTLHTERRSLVVIPKMAGQDGDPFVAVRGEGTYHCNGQRFSVEVLPWTDGMPLQQPAGTLVFDADMLKFPFVCRRWRQGDWMIPFGMKGRKKLSDIFTDLKYGHAEKDAAVVIVDCTGDLAERQHVAALAGVRMDGCYKVTASTKSIIKITLLS